MVMQHGLVSRLPDPPSTHTHLAFSLLSCICSAISPPDSPAWGTQSLSPALLLPLWPPCPPLHSVPSPLGLPSSLPVSG